MWNEHKCTVVWRFFAIALLWDGIKTNFFQSCGHWWVFQICPSIYCSTLTASAFRIWNSSAGIPSLPLALLIIMLLKAHLTSHSRMSGSRWVTTQSWLLVCIAKLLQSCLTLCDPVDCCPPGFSAHGILQARILEWIAVSSSRGSSWPRDWTRVSYVSCIDRQFLSH